MLNWVRDQAEKEADLQQYVPHLQSNTILRLLQQVIPVFFLSQWNPHVRLLGSPVFSDSIILIILLRRLHRSIKASSSPVWHLWFHLSTPSNWSAPLWMLLDTVICRYAQQEAL